MSDDAEFETEGSAQGGFFSTIPAIFWQRRWFIIVPLLVGSIAGVAAAFLLPPSYRSSATLLVESQQLPAELVGPTFTSLIDKRIAKIRQQVLSRPDLVELIQTNNLYASRRQREPLSSIIKTMRDATSITPVTADIAKEGQGSNTIAFSLTFDYSEPAKAQIVTQDFVDRLLKLDATQTAERGAGTVDFLQEQANTLLRQIAEVERKIEGIKGANGSTLSSAGTMMMPGGGGYEAQIAGLQKENSQLQTQLGLMATAAQRDPNVLAAEAQLAGARAVYSDNHPDVRLAEQRLAEARTFAAKNPLAETNTNALRSQIASNNVMIATLNQAKNVDRSRASSIISAQSRAPLITEQISQLDANAAQLRLTYQGVATNLMNARTAVRMSDEQKGERLSVVDPPIAPDAPIWPNRPLLIAGGVLGGAALGLVLALIFEFIRRPVRGVAAVERLTGSVPLVVIPTLKAYEQTLGRRRFFGIFGRKQPTEEAIGQFAQTD